MVQPSFYTNAVAITPSDTALLDPPPIGFMVGGAGNIVVETIGGQALTITAAAVNTVYPFKIRRVRSTGTTATAIVGLS